VQEILLIASVTQWLIAHIVADIVAEPLKN